MMKLHQLHNLLLHNPQVTVVAHPNGLLIHGAMMKTTMMNVNGMVELVVLHMKFLIGTNIVMIVYVLVG